jgi:DNA-binding response OmpR family regulator
MISIMAESGKVLLVEDEAIIAMDMEMSLSDRGWTVMGPVSTTEQALEIVAAGLPDIAVLDFNIRGGTSEDIALFLIARGVPVVFLSGDLAAIRVDALRDCHALLKPVTMNLLHDTLAEVLAQP